MAALPLGLVAAVARNGVIGRDNALPWRLRSDLQHFRALTLGKPVIMGRRTFESIGRPLPGRETIVVTRDRGFAAPGTHVASSIEAAVEAAQAIGMALAAREIAVVGGSGIFAATMPHATALHVTEVDLAPPGDVFFPPIDPGVWREVSRETHPPSPHDEAAFAFVEYAHRT